MPSLKPSSLTRGIAVGAVRQLAPRLTELAPGLTSSFVREALNRAIRGFGPLPPAAAAAEAQLREQHGNVERAVHEVIENHVRYAGVGGLVTNLGGLITAAIVAPANITELAMIQSRMVAGIAHLRGYDLDDPRVRNAILETLIGEETVAKLVRKMQLPGPPMAVATAPQHDPRLDQTITTIVAGELVSRVVGKRLATTAGKKIPLVGGLVGMGADGYLTWKVGRYADRELMPRPARY